MFFKRANRGPQVSCLGRPYKNSSSSDIYADVNWCRDALIFHVNSGRGALSVKCLRKQDEYRGQLQLDRTVLIKAVMPECPTCAGMLATGYGIENAQCEELDQIRNRLNEDFRGLDSAFEAIKPLLGLLDDGYYMLADTDLTPTDGHRFFYNVPNEFIYNEATSGYYIFPGGRHLPWICPCPYFIYPTQSVDLINQERVEHYIELLKNGADIRGLSYHMYGFVDALLDGHHKAVAAARLGIKLKCLSVIPCRGFIGMTGRLKYPDDNSATLSFCGKEFYIDDYHAPSTHKNDMAIINETGHITDNRFKDEEANLTSKYFDFDCIAADLFAYKFTDEQIESYLVSPSVDGNFYLECALIRRSQISYESARELAMRIIKKNDPSFPCLQAWKTLRIAPDEEIIDLAVDYYVNHDRENNNPIMEVIDQIIADTGSTV